MPNKKGIIRFFIRLGIFVGIVVLVIASTILINLYGPSPKIYSDDSWSSISPLDLPGFNKTYYNVRLDHHSHTFHSDGVLSVRQNIEWHIAMGYNAMVITDHNTLAHKSDIDEIKADYTARNITIILGMEWTTNRIHLNFLGISEWNLPIPSDPTDADIIQAIQEVHSQGGVVVVNHIPWSLRVGMVTHPSREQLRNWHVNYFEIINDDSLPQDVFDSESNDFCDTYNIGKITGTDMHRPDDLGGGGVSGFTLINVSTISEANIMVELRNNRTRIFRANIPYPDPVQHPDNPWYIVVKPLSDIGGLFIALYEDGLIVTGTIVYLIYIFSIFALIEVFIFVKPKVLAKIKARKEKDISSER